MNKKPKHNKPTNHKKPVHNTGKLDHHSKQAFLGLVAVAVVALWSIQGGLGSIIEKMVA